MTDLTDKWKKGELPSGWYWVDYYSVDGAVMLEYIPQHNGFGYEEKELVQAVLAEVPDYVEWQASEKYNKHLEEVIKIYERKDKQATETSIAYNELTEENEKLKSKLQLKETAYDFDTARLEEENVKLKELLKECRTYISEWDTPMDILARIDEVLGEK